MSIRCLKHSSAALGALCLLAAAGLPAFAANVDGPGGGPRDNNGAGCNLFPASAATAASVVPAQPRSVKRRVAAESTFWRVSAACRARNGE